MKSARSSFIADTREPVGFLLGFVFLLICGDGALTRVHSIWCM
jgi:hypothetical protein